MCLSSNARWGGIVAAGLPAGRGEARTADTISLNDVGVGYGYAASGRGGTGGVGG